MVVRTSVKPALIAWAVDQAGTEVGELEARLPRLPEWIEGRTKPTFNQLRDLARRTGVPLGYLFLPEPPARPLPIPDFREGFAASQSGPSPDLLAVIHLSVRRQAWYKEYAEANGFPPVPVVGSAAPDATPGEIAQQMRQAFDYEVESRPRTKEECRKRLLRGFERLGGLTVATSMVGNNTTRLLDPEEFRGFSLSDPLAPLVFVNSRQTLNGQLFTLAHEFAHIWRAQTGIGLDDPWPVSNSSSERWCNDVASEFLVPAHDLAERANAWNDAPLEDALEALAHDYRCGTLVVLTALHRNEIRPFSDFSSVYDREYKRVKALAEELPQRKGGGDFYYNQPFRIGERLSRALLADTLQGNTGTQEAMRLMAFGSLSTLDEYARKVGVA